MMHRNGGFPAEWHVAQAANASVQAGDPFRLNYDNCNCNSGQAWSARLSAYNAAVRLPKLFAQVFGPTQVGRSAAARVKPLLAGQSSDSRFLQGQLEYLNATQPGAIDNLAALAMAAYFDIERSLQKNTSLTGAEILASFNRSLAAHQPNLQSQFATHAVLRLWYSVPEMRGYESGPSSFGGESVPGKVQANQAPEMQALVERMYLYWHQHGFNTLNYFHAGGSRGMIGLQTPSFDSVSRCARLQLGIWTMDSTLADVYACDAKDQSIGCCCSPTNARNYLGNERACCEL